MGSENRWQYPKRLAVPPAVLQPAVPVAATPRRPGSPTATLPDPPVSSGDSIPPLALVPRFPLPRDPRMRAQLLGFRGIIEPRNFDEHPMRSAPPRHPSTPRSASIPSTAFFGCRRLLAADGLVPLMTCSPRNPPRLPQLISTGPLLVFAPLCSPSPSTEPRRVGFPATPARAHCTDATHHAPSTLPTHPCPGARPCPVRLPLPPRNPR